MKTRSVLIVAAALLAVVVGAFVFLQWKPDVDPVPGEVPAEAPVVKSTATPAPNAPAATPSLAASTQSATPKAAPTPPPPRPLEPWEAKIDEALQVPGTEAQSAQLLINLLPTLPAEGQREAAQHITNLTEDQNYKSILPLIRNPQIAEDAQDILVMDLLNREEHLKLPTLLEIAKLPQHPYHEQALSDLGAFLDGDYGQDWAKWDGSIKDYLKKLDEANGETRPAPNAPAAK